MLLISELNADLGTTYLSIAEGNHASSRVFLQMSQCPQIEHVDIGEKFVLVECVLDHDLIVIHLELAPQHINVVGLNNPPSELVAIIDACSVL